MGNGRIRREGAGWVEVLRQRHRDLVSPFVAALDAADRATSKRRLTCDDLRPLVAAASSDRVPLYEAATSVLGGLLPKVQEARKAVEQMSRDRKSQVRFNALLCIDGKTPTPLAIAI